MQTLLESLSDIAFLHGLADTQISAVRIQRIDV